MPGLPLCWSQYQHHRNPFYTWSRKNITLQLEKIVTNPDKMAAIGKVKASLEFGDTDLPDQRFIAKFIKTRSNVRVRKNPQSGNWEYFILDSWLPAADINKIADPLDAMWGMSTPLLKS